VGRPAVDFRNAGSPGLVVGAMTTGQGVLLACVVLVVGFAVYRVATDGRFRRSRRLRGAAPGTPPVLTAATVLTGAGVAVPLGERATLLQFSSAFCAPCGATRRVLGEVARLVPGVTHVEVDAEAHLDAVRTLRVLRTPTTLILDADGREVARAAGLPRRDQVLAALSRKLVHRSG
jgi:thiol-disulfide isomerase/thioredoxin